MSSALRIPKPKVEEGSVEEPLVCDCGHEFTRGQLDSSARVEDFSWSGSPQDLRDTTAWELLEDHVIFRDECPACSCCAEQDGEICQDVSKLGKQWMCSECLGIHDNEEDALDCCG